MKKLFLIGGTMGVGKTTVSQRLKMRLDKSVFLDGDWCWDAHPFQVTEETRAMVMRNICALLNNFLKCTAYEHVIFCWVMHEQSIINEILSHLSLEGCEIVAVSLVCSQEEVVRRLKKDVEAGLRTEDVIERSVQRLDMYHKLNTIQIDTSNLTPEEIAEKIANL